ncbi:unnamed protein product, partial [Allacma fusca]
MSVILEVIRANASCWGGPQEKGVLDFN